MSDNAEHLLVAEKDNAKGAVGKLLAINKDLRNSAWPHPLNETTHFVRKSDARDLS